MIQVVDLVKRFGALQAVREISFQVKEGELFGFLGPNGAGKTTTINILCTLLAPTSGKAFVAGYDVFQQPTAVRRSIGIIFQDPSLDERLTALENLKFHAMLYHLPRKKTAERMEMLLKMVGLSERHGDLVKTFSGGMKRRLEIVRGLLHYPKVLFLDEPTLGLDPQTRNHIWNYVKELRQKEGLTLFLTTHYMEEADQCDRIAIMDEGKIIALDTPAAFKQRLGSDTLDEVFVKLIGHEIREENASGKDQLRDLHKKWIGRMR